LRRSERRFGRGECELRFVAEAARRSYSSLTSLVSLDPIYVYFDVDEQTYLKYARQTERHGISSHDLRSAALLGLADEDGFPRSAR